MQRALAIALVAQENGEPPFGALIVDESATIVAEASDEVAQGRDFSLHAELNAVRRACQRLGPRLHGATLYTTVEPCPMCFTAAWLARVPRIVYGATMEAVFEATAGAQRELRVPASVLNALAPEPLILDGGVLAQQCLRPFARAAALGAT
jgi:tRNA(Arg) A34 adenosine deaminase TadA